jgi:hypothetical protein
VKKLPLLLAVVALGVPSTAAAARQSGVVVKVDRQAHLIAVAQRAGRVVRVHAPAKRFSRSVKPFRVGQRLSFAARKLRNGTLAGSAFRVGGRAQRVSVHGVVRAYNARNRMLALATGGSVLRMRLARVRTLMASAPAPPKVGSEVDVTLALDDEDDELEATDVQQADGEDAEQADDDQQQAGDDDQQQADDEEEADEDDGQDAEDDQEAEEDHSGHEDDSGDGDEEDD